MALTTLGSPYFGKLSRINEVDGPYVGNVE